MTFHEMTHEDRVLLYSICDVCKNLHTSQILYHNANQEILSGINEEEEIDNTGVYGIGYVKFVEISPTALQTTKGEMREAASVECIQPAAVKFIAFFQRLG